MPAAISPRKFESALTQRLLRGEHLVLYGPRGGGKSALTGRLHARYRRTGVPCALSQATSGLDDITRALAQAYPQVDDTGLTRRGARSRLVAAADRERGVVLLDHVTDVTPAMLGFLRRLRGGVVGVLLVVDVDVERERQRLRRWGLGIFSLRIPPTPPRQLRRLFHAHCRGRAVPPLAPDQERQLIRMARGRPGWIAACAELIARPDYWHGDQLYVSVLGMDVEMVLRQPRLSSATSPARESTTRAPALASRTAPALLRDRGITPGEEPA